MLDLLNHNAAALFGLIGVVAGGILTFLTSFTLRNRDLRLKIWERFLDRRISAHEDVISLCMKMRLMFLTGQFEPTGEVGRAPSVLLSKEAFDEWLTEFAGVAGPATTWLSTSTKRELHFVQDYFVTLQLHLSGMPSERFPVIGSFLRQDFIDMSSNLEKSAFAFFESEAMKLKLDSLSKWHKYPVEETNRRFGETVLIGRLTELKKLIQNRES